MVVVSNGVAGAVATLEFAETYTLPDDGSYLTVTYTADTEAGYQFVPNQDTVFTLDSDGDEATAPTLEVIEYAITYMYDGKEIKDLEPTSYNVEDDDTALPTSLALTGVTLEGWYDNEDLKGDPVTSIAKGSTGAKTFYAKCTTVTPPEPEWDIPGTEGGINAIVGEGDAKYVEFSSIAFTATGATVGLKAGKIDANGQIFGLVCKTDLTKEETIVINATLTHAEGDLITEGLFTISANLSGYTQLFVIGVGPAKQN